MQDHQFKDTEGRDWSIVITVREYTNIKNETGIDIGKVFTQDDTWLHQLISQEDMNMFLQILGVCTDKQRKDLELSMEDFYGAIDGDVLQGATDALIEGVINFTHHSRRDALRKLMDATNQGLVEMGAAIAEGADENTEKMMKEMRPAILKEMRK